MVSWNELRQEPFRVFFPLGVLFGCVGVGHWLMYAVGWRQSYSGFYHAGIQVGAYMSCFIVGFLLTALPRFSATAPASSVELGLAIGLVVAYATGLWVKQWLAAEACFAALLLVVAAFAGRRFAKKAAPVGPPPEFVWIPLALLLGLLGTGLLILGQLGLVPSWWLGVGRPMVSQGFLLGIVMGVGGFMAPRLMGREVLLITPNGVSPERAHRIRRRRVWLHSLAGLAFFVSFVLEGGAAFGLAYLLRAGVVTAVFAWTAQFYQPPKVHAGYAKLLWVSIWMIIVGLWAAGFAPRFRVAMLHLSFLGGFSLMTFAVGTMVVLSHAGAARRLSEPLWVLRIVSLGMACAIAARLVAEVNPAAFFQWLGAASACWLIAGVSWLAFIVPSISQPSAPGTFEQVHEEAKQRLLRTSVTPC